MKKVTKFFSLGLVGVLTAGALAACHTSEGTTTTSSDTTTPGNETTQGSETTANEGGSVEAGPVNVYTRDSSSGTRGAFEELIGFEGELVGTALEVSANGDMASKVGADSNAIGYVSLTTDFEGNNIHPVSYEGVAPSVETVLDESYALKRPFAYVTRAEGDYESEEVEQLVAAFVDFLVNSTEGREAIDSEGGIVDVDAGTAWSELAQEHPIVNQDNSSYTIRTGGSTSVVKTLEAAIDAFKPLAGNVQFVSDHSGSGDGFKRTLGDEKDTANSADIGFASRDFKEDGTEDVSQGAQTGVYCQDAVVVVVHAERALESLTKQQVYDIFTGAVTNWEELN